MGSGAYSSQDFPDFMRAGAPVGGLSRLNQNLGSFFDTSGLQNSFNTMQQGQMSAAKAAAGSAARAATNRAMLSGGQVGSDFARASALQPFFRQQAQQNLDFGQLTSQMKQNQAQLSGNLLSQIAGLRAQDRASKQGYATDAARLAQKNYGISGTVGYGSNRSDVEDEFLRSQMIQTGQQVKPGYITNAGGIIPGSVGGQQMFNRAITGDLPTQRLY